MPTRTRKVHLKPKPKKVLPQPSLSNETSCLNCSIRAWSNGKRSIPIINYLEVANDNCHGSTEVISVTSAVNYIFKLPATNELTSQEGEEYGCCSDCCDVIRELYEGHKKLEGLNDTQSTLGQILASQSLNGRLLSSENGDMRNISEHEKVTNGSGFRQSGIPQPSTKGVKRARSSETQPGPASKSARTAEFQSHMPPSSFTVAVKPCPTEQCANCCQDLLPDIRPNGKSIKKGVTTGTVYGDDGKSVIPLSTVLSSVFKLPPLNPLTENVVFCSDCAKALMLMYGGNVMLSKAAAAESHLNYVSATIESIIATSEIVVQEEEEGSPESRLPNPKPVIASPSKNLKFKGKRQLSGSSAMASYDAIPNGASSDEDQGSPAPLKPLRKPPTRKSQEVNLKVTPSKTKKKTATEVKQNGARRSNRLPEEVKEERKQLRRMRTLANIKEYKRRIAEKASLIPQGPCPHCGKVFKSKNPYWIKRHIKAVHEEAYKHSYLTRFLCMTCGRPCQNNIQKLNHEQTHLNAAERRKLEAREPKKRFVCTECGKVLTTEKYLKDHIANKHQDTEQRRVHCEKCDFSCLTAKTLKAHDIRVHDPTSAPRFQCKECNAGFKLYTDLKEHEMVECDVSNRPHACDQGSCQKKFKRKQSLVLHLYQVHKMKPEEAREKHYPGLPCPKWLGLKHQKKKQQKKV